MNFQEETDQWMATLGYTPHSCNSTKTVLIYTKGAVEFPYHPIITCKATTDGWHCSLSGSVLKYLVRLHIGYISYKHPDMNNIIETVAHYERICQANTPII